LPFVSKLCAWRASKQEVAAKLLRDTGSDIGPRGVELYTRLFSYPGHIRAALMMMAQWELRPLLRDLPRLAPALFLMVGSRDAAVPPMQARRVQAILPAARVSSRSKGLVIWRMRKRRSGLPMRCSRNGLA
jgi:magnesium chelatase accessory protein